MLNHKLYQVVRWGLPLCGLVAVLAFAHPAQAVGPIVVTTTADTVADDGACSLREAITAANSNAVSGVLPGECAAGELAPAVDTIAFAIPGDGPHTLTPVGTVWPYTDEPVFIDGLTQPGASCATWPPTLKIVLSGAAPADTVGLDITGGNSTVRGLVINSFAKGPGIHLSDEDSNRVECNLLGTDVTGAVAQPNYYGVWIDAPSGNTSRLNTVGGATSDKRNVISGNSAAGINIEQTSGNIIQGNYIGVDVTGKAKLGNDGYGIYMINADDNVIGGVNAGERNIISDNNYDGVTLEKSNRNLIQGNYIGVDVSGASNFGNANYGVSIVSSYSNTVGGSVAGAGNTIAFNDDTGVDVRGTAASNRIWRNRIFNNGGLEINLVKAAEAANTVTPNDVGDPDDGPNLLQNFPELTAATAYPSEGRVVIAGKLNSLANTTFHIEFFNNTFVDPSGHGPGLYFLGSADVTTDGAGNSDFTVDLSAFVLPASNVTATATDPDGNTSEFSAPVQLTILAPDLAIKKLNQPGYYVFSDEPLTYTLVASNTGTYTATSVVVADYLPAGTTFQSITAPAGWTCVTPAVGQTGAVECSKPSLGPKEGATFVVVVGVLPTLVPNAKITNTAYISSYVVPQSIAIPQEPHNKASAINEIVTVGLELTKTVGTAAGVCAGSSQIADSGRHADLLLLHPVQRQQHDPHATLVGGRQTGYPARQCERGLGARRHQDDHRASGGAGRCHEYGDVDGAQLLLHRVPDRRLGHGDRQRRRRHALDHAHQDRRHAGRCMRGRRCRHRAARHDGLLLLHGDQHREHAVDHPHAGRQQTGQTAQSGQSTVGGGCKLRVHQKCGDGQPVSGQHGHLDSAQRRRLPCHRYGYGERDGCCTHCAGWRRGAHSDSACFPAPGQSLM